MFSKMATDTVCIGLVTVVLLLLIYILLRYKDTIIDSVLNNWTPRFFKLLKNMPCPSHVFIIGCVLELQGSQDEHFQVFRKFVKKCPKIYKLWILNYLSVHLVNPYDIEKVLTSNNAITKSTLYQLLNDWLQDGLLTSTGAKWHQRRKLLTPAFHFSILKQFTNVFAEQSLKLVEQLQKDCGKSPLNIIEYMTEFTLTAISETAMGYRQDTNENTDTSKPSEFTNYKKAIHRYGKLLYYVVLRPWLYNRTLFPLTPTGRKQKKITAVLHKFTKQVIKERMSDFDNLILENSDKDDNDSKKRLAMLDLLISQKLNGGLIDDEGIAEEVDTFMFEGHDTTATALSFTLMLLANHREIQDRIYEEVTSIMGDEKSKLPNYSDLQQMVFLERCIKESLRLYPPVWVIANCYCKLDADVELDDYLLPAKLEVFIRIYDLHRNPDFWPNPDVFDPDRFLPENTQKRHPFAYIPFSAGPRNCIGQKFALLEEKTLISTVLRNFILEPVDTPETIMLKADLVLRAKNGIKIKVLPRL